MPDATSTIATLVRIISLPTAEDAAALQATLEKHGVTPSSLSAKLFDGRPALLAYLKDAGVDKLGIRQKLASEVSKAARLGTLPEVDGKRLFSVTADMEASSLVTTATTLKQRGNDAFKAGDTPLALALYSDAARAAAVAAKEESAAADATKLLVSAHANLAAAQVNGWDSPTTPIHCH